MATADVLQRPQNRFRRRQAEADVTSQRSVHEALCEKPGRTHPAEVAIEVLLPGVFSKELIQRVIQENGGDSDAALDVLLGSSAVHPEKEFETPLPPSVAPSAEYSEKAVPPEEPLKMDEDLAIAIALSLEQQDTSELEPAVEASVDEVEANTDIETSGWTVVEAEPTQRATCDFVTNSEAPPWLPMLRTGGKDTSSAKPTFYDLQTQRLKAALGSRPQISSTSFASKDLHGVGKGSGRKGGS